MKERNIEKARLIWQVQADRDNSVTEIIVGTLAGAAALSATRKWFEWNDGRLRDKAIVDLSYQQPSYLEAAKAPNVYTGTADVVATLVLLAAIAAHRISKMW